MGYNLPEILNQLIPVIEESAMTLREAFFDPESLNVERGKAEVDVAVEIAIREAIFSRYPQMGFRAEEQPEFNRSPDPGCDLTWLLDPHDGTTAASRGFRGASISLALIRDGLPVLGIVCAYAAPTGGIDMISWAEGLDAVVRNGQIVVPAPRLTPVALVSKYADRRAGAYVKALAPYRYLASPGIAYRLARVAAGDADVAISLSVPRDFDCAGGHALLLGAGMDLFDEAGREIRYHDDAQAQYHYCFGGPRILCERFAALNWESCLASKASASQTSTPFEPSARMLELDENTLKRAQGAWLAFLIGDALGAQTEGRPHDEIRAHFPNGAIDFGNLPGRRLLTGQVTDDSEMAKALCASLLDIDDHDPNHAVSQYVDWLNSRPFSLGQTTMTALSAAANNCAPAAAARQAANMDSQANGALMRVLPIGIAGVHRSEAWTLDAAAADARLTHPHPVCVAANRVYAGMIRHGVKEGCSADELYQFVTGLVARDPLCAPVADLVHAAAQEEPADFLTHMGWVQIALQNALYGLKADSTIINGLNRTISRGGDTDTNACIAGGVLGSIYGIDSLPAPWVEAVLTCRPHHHDADAAFPRPANYWAVDGLVVAERLLSIGSKTP